MFSVEYRLFIYMGRKRKYTLNENYFDVIDTSNKAYVLGFIYADGSVYKNYLSIVINIRDVTILEFIKRELSYNGPLYFKGDYVKLNICSKKLTEQLKHLGILENKTYVSDRLPNVDYHLKPNLLLGFFDGDGSIYKSGDKDYSYTINFTNNLKVLKEIKNYLYESSISSSKIRKRYDNEISCMLDIRGSKNIEKIYKLLYDNPPDYFFNRKKNRFDEFMHVVNNMTKRDFTDNMINEIKTLYDEGLTQKSISDKLNLKYSSVRCVIQRLRKSGVLI